MVTDLKNVAKTKTESWHNRDRGRARTDRRIEQGGKQSDPRFQRTYRGYCANVHQGSEAGNRQAKERRDANRKLGRNNTAPNRMYKHGSGNKAEGG
eukprot:scaffold538539_cov134-Attheya_sp.AAC.1